MLLSLRLEMQSGDPYTVILYIIIVEHIEKEKIRKSGVVLNRKL